MIMKKPHVVVLKKKSIWLTLIVLTVCILLILLTVTLLSDHGKETVGQNQEYTILGANDLGMHCYQQDYSGFLLLPPGNTLKVQVFKKGTNAARLVTSGIEVSYEIIDNTTSADKTNFWDYAKDYGFDVPPNVGISGNSLKGTFTLSADGKYFEATYIPVTPYNDGSDKLNPYQMAHIKATDKNTGELLAQIDNIVVPVSDEMKCSVCHGEANTDRNILSAHDELSGTSLLKDLENGKRYKCSACHQENILGDTGQAGVPPLSQAMHGFHAGKMSMSDIEPACYSCHPGPVTQCYRGIMYLSGVNCVNSKCHGDMANIAKTQADGRQAWLEEPNCSNCHDARYGVNADTLYRNSYLQNSPSSRMNDLILCPSCHNGTHAEWKSSEAKDNEFPISLLGYASFIDQCEVCHNGSGKMHRGG